MTKIIIAPYAAMPLHQLPVEQREGWIHPKSYAHWNRLIDLILSEGYKVIQVGVKGEHQLVDDFRQNLSFDELEKLVKECDTWISIDSFLQHFCWQIGKRGIVIFTKSNPNIFGHHENINLLKHPKYLRKNQFWWWSQEIYQEDASIDPGIVMDALKALINTMV